jgi:VCBS repeat-containing protein
MIHVNLHIQHPEQWEIINSFRSDGQMAFDTDKCHSIQRLKGQLTVTDKFTVHEDQITEIQCSRHPKRA